MEIVSIEPCNHRLGHYLVTWCDTCSEVSNSDLTAMPIVNNQNQCFLSEQLYLQWQARQLEIQLLGRGSGEVVGRVANWKIRLPVQIVYVLTPPPPLHFMRINLITPFTFLGNVLQILQG